MKNKHGSNAALPKLPQSPEFLERYEVVEYLSSGKQYDTFVVRSYNNNELFVARIFRENPDAANENTILAKLNHPAVPKPVEIITTENEVCFIREYIKGQPLDMLNLPLDEGKACDICIQLCDVLIYLHNQKPPVIHRDIKPQNVIIDDDGCVHLIDFGISRVFSEEATQDTSLIVTEGYAPPEQYGFKQTDSRADVYSLGMLMCFLLTGNRDLGALDKLENRRLAKVIRKCIAFAPENRYYCADAVKKALQKSVKKRNPRVWITAALISLLLVAGIVIWQFQGISDLFARLTERGPVFTEPLIEQAARLMLGVNDDERLSEEDLALIEALYINYDRVFDNRHDYYSYFGPWGHGPADVQGPVVSLEDLRMMPNIEELYIQNQQITDIGPISSLTKLRYLQLGQNPTSDLSPLEGLIYLEEIHLSIGTFIDISPLTRLPNLKFLEIFGCPYVNVHQIQDFRYLQTLIILLTNASYPFHHYLPDIPLIYLNVETSPVDSLEWFSAYKSSLRTLMINMTRIRSLEGIEEFTELEVLNISRINVSDFTPLLLLPNLRVLYVSPNMLSALAEIRDQIQFEVILY